MFIIQPTGCKRKGIAKTNAIATIPLVTKTDAIGETTADAITAAGTTVLNAAAVTGKVAICAPRDAARADDTLTGTIREK